MARIAALILIAMAGLIAPAQADVTISSQATSNMSCSSGVCAPTAIDAVLNVTDLETLLASGNATVTTTASGIQADNIAVKAALSWSSTSTLALDAYESIMVDKAVSVAGVGGLSLATDDGGSGGTLSFGAKGHVTFANLSSALASNGATYTLVGDIATLASDIAADPGGDFALAADYNASGDGTYTDAPVMTTLSGMVEGVGNTISNITVKGGEGAGLFAQTASGSVVENLGLSSVSVNVTNHASYEGGLIEKSSGLLFGDHVSGLVEGEAIYIGGLSGQNVGTVTNSYATATVHAGAKHGGGGLIGLNGGFVTECFATGKIKGKGNGGVGGLLGVNEGNVTNSYSTGTVSAGSGTETGVGGFVADDGGEVSVSYSTGAVSGGAGADVGGFEAWVDEENISDLYWDTTTSGTDQGTGNEGNIPGITGLTTKQLKSGLPAGFDPAIWAEKKSINNGFPYLIANPPPK